MHSCRWFDQMTLLGPIQDNKTKKIQTLIIDIKAETYRLMIVKTPSRFDISLRPEVMLRMQS